ncbi:MAG: hypothetical protein V3T70_00780, partial [Phycisphaerae bacterium]
MPHHASDRILKFVGRADYRPMRVRELSRALEIEEAQYAAFRRDIAALQADGRLALGGGNRISLAGMPRSVTGEFRLNR